MGFVASWKLLKPISFILLEEIIQIRIDQRTRVFNNLIVINHLNLIRTEAGIVRYKSLDKTSEEFN